MVGKSTAEESNPAVIGVLFLFFFLPHAVLYLARYVWDMAVELQWWHSSCWHFLAHGNHFLPTVTLFGSPREAKDPRWIVFCSALLLFYPSTDPFFYFFSFSSPCLFYCHRVVCSVSSSLSPSLYSGVLPPPPPPSCLAPYSQSFHRYCELALMASSCSSLSRL